MFPKPTPEPPFYTVEIETYCEYVKAQVKLTLQSQNPKHVRAKIVQGEPIFCNKEFVCPHKDQPRCFLKALWIETRR